jgi:hypothetical protein
MPFPRPAAVAEVRRRFMMIKMIAKSFVRINLIIFCRGTARHAPAIKIFWAIAG